MPHAVAVVGAGLMGSGIAQVAAVAGHDVVLRDVGAEAVARGMDAIKKSLDRFVSKGTLTAEAADAAVARITATTDLEAVDRADVIVEAVDRCRLAAQAKHIDVAVGGAAGGVVYGDHSLLVTAVRNLVHNAIAYSPERTRVGVSVRRAAGLVEVAVSDQGIGIGADDQQRIFERFYRVDQARSRATGGTGLGLSIVKHVAANHGGEVTVWSVEGQGSTFTLRLPDSAHAAAAASPAGDAGAPTSALSGGSGAAGPTTTQTTEPASRGALP